MNLTMDFRNGHFFEELNSVRKRIIQSPVSSGTISQDSLQITPNSTDATDDTENNYINLDTFTTNIETETSDTNLNINYRSKSNNTDNINILRY